MHSEMMVCFGGDPEPALVATLARRALSEGLGPGWAPTPDDGVSDWPGGGHVPSPGDPARELNGFIFDADGEVVGGIVGAIEGNRLVLSNLWVEPAVRNGDLGSYLLLCAERRARERGCDEALAAAHSLSGVEYLRRRSYQLVDVVDVPDTSGLATYWMQKPLAASVAVPAVGA